jgi:peptidoglycan L-alanyl-D-glutamate endopeptidase CwlK
MEIKMTIDEMVRAVQAELHLNPDGNAGPLTWTAIYQKIISVLPSGVSVLDRVDERSERFISTLLPEVRPFARALVQKAAAQGIDIKVISGMRTYSEQNDLYAQGRTLPGKIVTNAKGGQSNHNFGIAFDIGIFDGRRYLEQSPLYKAVGAIGKGLGLEWGGDWKSIIDEPHFQLRPAWATKLSNNELMAELRNRHEREQGIFA